MIAIEGKEKTSFLRVVSHNGTNSGVDGPTQFLSNKLGTYNCTSEAHYNYEISLFFEIDVLSAVTNEFE